MSVELPIVEETIPGFLHVLVYRAPDSAYDFLVYECGSRRGEPVRLGLCVFAGRYRKGRWISTIGKIAESERRRIASLVPG